MSTPEPAPSAHVVDEHAGREQAFRHLGAADIPSDLTNSQRHRVGVVTARMGVQRRRVSSMALAAKVKAVAEARKSGNPQWVVSALEDLASTCLAWASWIRKHGLHEGRGIQSSVVRVAAEAKAQPLPTIPAAERAHWLALAYRVEATTPVAIVARVLYLHVECPWVTQGEIAEALGIGEHAPRRWARKAELE